MFTQSLDDTTENIYFKLGSPVSFDPAELPFKLYLKFTTGPSLASVNRVRDYGYLTSASTWSTSIFHGSRFLGTWQFSQFTRFPQRPCTMDHQQPPYHRQLFFFDVTPLRSSLTSLNNIQ